MSQRALGGEDQGGDISPEDPPRRGSVHPRPCFLQAVLYYRSPCKQSGRSGTQRETRGCTSSQGPIRDVTQAAVIIMDTTEV